MKITRLFLLSLLALFSLSCSNKPKEGEKIDGVYIVDKEALKRMLTSNLKPLNTLESKRLELAVDNALIELKISEDSINGIISIYGIPILVNSKIKKYNDSLITKFTDDIKVLLKPTKRGFLYEIIGKNISYNLIKTDRTALSTKTKRVVKTQKAVEKEKKENTVGIWRIKYYVDDFNEPTDQAYLTATAPGVFSNSATNNSDLSVQFVVDKDEIRLQLYEYGRDNPVKSGSFDFFIRDKNKIDYKLTGYATSSGDIRTDASPSYLDDYKRKELKKILLSGGEIRFLAKTKYDHIPSVYRFTIPNADGLEEALKKIYHEKD